MSLISRLAGIGDPETTHKLPINALWAVTYEIRAQRITLPQIIAHWGFDEGEQTELVWLMTRYAEQPDEPSKVIYLDQLRAIFMLAESKFPGYSTEAEIVTMINAI